MSRRQRKHEDAASFDIVEHASGLAVRVHASNWRELLRMGARAMFESAVPHARSDDEATQMIPVELESRDYETLLADWLSELISLSEQHSLLFTRFEILQLDVDETCRLTAMAEGVPRTEASERLPIKALVSKRLKIDRTSRGLTTTIVFEV